MSGELRLCERCSHLRSEHRTGTVIVIAGVRDLIGAWCSCCDCPAFVDEPDYLPSPRPPAPRRVG